MTILGAAIGSKQHCLNWISVKLNKKLPVLINKLELLGHSQSSFLLLLYCASFCKIVWYIWTIPSFLISESCDQFDSLVLHCFENLLGAGLSKQSLSQARLGTKNGGVGLRASKSHSAAAYISSFFKSKPLVETFLSKSIINPHLRCLCETFNSLVSADDQINSSLCPPSQKSLSHKIDSFSLKGLLDDVCLVDKARLVSCSMSLMPVHGLGLYPLIEINFLVWNGPLVWRDGWASPSLTKIISVLLVTTRLLMF